MADTCPTMKVTLNESGGETVATINKEDFDEALHTEVKPEGRVKLADAK